MFNFEEENRKRIIVFSLDKTKETDIMLILNRVMSTLGINEAEYFLQAKSAKETTIWWKKGDFLIIPKEEIPESFRNFLLTLDDWRLDVGVVRSRSVNVPEEVVMTI